MKGAVAGTSPTGPWTDRRTRVRTLTIEVGPPAPSQPAKRHFYNDPVVHQPTGHWLHNTCCGVPWKSPLPPPPPGRPRRRKAW